MQRLKQSYQENKAIIEATTYPHKYTNYQP